MERRGKRRKQLLDDIKDTGNWKRKHYVALCGELGLEEAIDCRKTDYGMNFFFFTVVPCILVLSESFIYQLMHNRIALKEY